MKILHDSKPLAGVSVDVLSNNEKQFSAVSTKNGTVFVSSLKPGDYWLRVQRLGVPATYQCFHVKEHHTRQAKKKLRFDWGDLAPSTRLIAGDFIDSQPGKGGTPIWNLTHRVPVPIVGAAFKLTNGLTGVEYKSKSDSSGRFQFPSVPSGTYVLHVESGTNPGGRSYDSGDFVVKVSATAQYEGVSLTSREAGGGNCGGISLQVRKVSE